MRYFVVPPVFETNPSGASHAKAPNKSLLHDVEMDDDLLILDLKDGWASKNQRSLRDLLILLAPTNFFGAAETPHHQPAEIGVKSWRPGYSATPGGKWPWVDDLFTLISACVGISWYIIFNIYGFVMAFHLFLRSCYVIFETEVLHSLAG